MPQAMEDRASRRTLLVTAAVVVAVTALLVVALAGGPGRPQRGEAVPGGRIPPDVTVAAALSSLTVLRDWDRMRARAWHAGDVSSLRRLYTPTSRAGRRDIGMLRRWADRGLRVHGMAMQVLDVELRARTDRRIVLVVTDRLTGPVAVGRAGHRWALPQDGLTTRRLEFVRTGGAWRVARVYDLPARPLATTSETVGSANS